MTAEPLWPAVLAWLLLLAWATLAIRVDCAALGVVILLYVAGSVPLCLQDRRLDRKHRP